VDTSDWIEHRRGDGERVGWMRPQGDGFVAVDLLGRDVTGAVEWLEAEEVLDELGIGYLADAYLMDRPDAAPLRVRIVEVSQSGIRVKQDDFGDMSGPARLHYELDWPIPATLRTLASDPDAARIASEFPAS
jgi:hypothetical protein